MSEFRGDDHLLFFVCDRPYPPIGAQYSIWYNGTR